MKAKKTVHPIDIGFFGLITIMSRTETGFELIQKTQWRIRIKISYRFLPPSFLRLFKAVEFSSTRLESIKWTRLNIFAKDYI